MLLSDICLRCGKSASKEKKFNLNLNSDNNLYTFYACSDLCLLSLKKLIIDTLSQYKCFTKCKCQDKTYVYGLIINGNKYQCDYLEPSKNQSFFNCYNLCDILLEILVNNDIFRICYIGSNKLSLNISINNELLCEYGKVMTRIDSITKSINKKYESLLLDVNNTKKLVSEINDKINVTQDLNNDMKNEMIYIKNEMVNIKILINDFIHLFNNSRIN